MAEDSWWAPTPAQREAAAFEHAYRTMAFDLSRRGRVPPSREVVLEAAARRHETPTQMCARVRAALRVP